MENTSITSLPQKLISFSLCSAFLPIETKQGGFCFFVSLEIDLNSFLFPLTPSPSGLSVAG